jgi:hypothetical protein
MSSSKLSTAVKRRAQQINLLLMRRPFSPIGDFQMFNIAQIFQR